jgi:hypothetical protein
MALCGMQGAAGMCSGRKPRPHSTVHFDAHMKILQMEMELLLLLLHTHLLGELQNTNVAITPVTRHTFAVEQCFGSKALNSNVPAPQKQIQEWSKRWTRYMQYFRRGTLLLARAYTSEFCASEALQFVYTQSSL